MGEREEWSEIEVLEEERAPPPDPERGENQGEGAGEDEDLLGPREPPDLERGYSIAKLKRSRTTFPSFTTRSTSWR